jgi:isopentenyldiphosphate isomerase
MRRAAIRRVKFEMGIHDLNEEDLHVGSRILYYADASEEFAEYELDYIIFTKKDI